MNVTMFELTFLLSKAKSAPMTPDEATLVASIAARMEALFAQSPTTPTPTQAPTMPDLQPDANTHAPADTWEDAELPAGAGQAQPDTSN